MNKQQIERAADILVQARRDMQPLTGLPDGLKPTTIEEAHAIQDAVSDRLGKLIGASRRWRPPTATRHEASSMAARSTRPGRSRRHRPTVRRRRRGRVHLSPRPAGPRQTVHPERGRRRIDACAAIEAVHSRFAQKANVSNLEKLADSISNGALVQTCPAPIGAAFNWANLRSLSASMANPGLEQVGGHPTGDPLGVAVVLANIWREKGGVRAGQFVTCGSFTGLKYFKPGDVCSVRFEGRLRRGHIHEGMSRATKR